MNLVAKSGVLAAKNTEKGLISVGVDYQSVNRGHF
jgi:hypothetical protein